MAINWDVLQRQSTERLVALEEQIAESLRREMEGRRRELEEQERKKRKKRKRRRRP